MGNMQGGLPPAQPWIGHSRGNHLPPSGGLLYKKLPETMGSGAGPRTNADARHPIIVNFMQEWLQKFGAPMVTKVLDTGNKTHVDFQLLRGHVGPKNQNLVCMVNLLARCGCLKCPFHHVDTRELYDAYCHQVCNVLRLGMLYLYTQMPDQVKSAGNGRNRRGQKRKGSNS